jgi:predicted metal-dependent hydrolase
MENRPPNIINLRDHEIPYSVRVSKRATRYHISISEKGLEVVLPIGIPIEKAESLLHKNSAWVLTHWEKISRRIRHADMPTLPRNTILYRGKPTPLRLTTDPSLKSRAIAEFRGKFVQIRVPTNVKRIPKNTISAWLTSEARILITQRVAQLSTIYRLHPKQISIRNQRTRWGSCSSTRSLSFNWRLVMVPVEVMDYVIIHELSHMDEPNHSTGFWALVASRCPDYKKYRLWLKHNTHLLHPDFD